MGATEDEMVGWHHLLSEHEFEQTLGDSEGQGNLACCSAWGCKESEPWLTKSQFSPHLTGEEIELQNKLTCSRSHGQQMCAEI